MNDYVLIHHGILGMKWGVRRYQNKDGTLTELGKKRNASAMSYSQNGGSQFLSQRKMNEIKREASKYGQSTDEYKEAVNMLTSDDSIRLKSRKAAYENMEKFEHEIAEENRSKHPDWYKHMTDNDICDSISETLFDNIVEKADRYVDPTGKQYAEENKKVRELLDKVADKTIGEANTYGRTQFLIEMNDRLNQAIDDAAYNSLSDKRRRELFY